MGVSMHCLSLRKGSKGPRFSQMLVALQLLLYYLEQMPIEN